MIAFALVVPFASAADWTQVGGSSSRNFASEDVAPEGDEVAFVVDLPGRRLPGLPLLIHEGKGHAILDESADREQPVPTAVYTVDIHTAEVARAFTLSSSVAGWAIHRDGYLISDETGVSLVEADGGVVWTWPEAVEGSVVVTQVCIPPLVHHDIVYVSCHELPPPQDVDRLRSLDRSQPHMQAAIHIPTGIEKWRFAGGAPEQLLLVGDRLFAFQWQLSESQHAHVEARDVDDGACRFLIRQHLEAPALIEGETSALMNRGRDATAMRVNVIGNGREVIVAFDGIRGYDAFAADAACDNFHDVPASWSIRPQTLVAGTSDMAFANSRLYAGHGPELRVVDFTPNPVDQTLIDLSTGHEFGRDSVVGAANVVFAISTDPIPTPDEVYERTLYVVGADGGQPSQRAFLSKQPDAAPALGEGVFVFTGMVDRHSGEISDVETPEPADFLMVLGRTRASIQPTIQWPEPYPAVGAAVTLTTEGTRPGVLDPMTARRVDWGDGNFTGWQNQTVPTFEHVYSEYGDRLVRVEFKNGAGQTAVEETLLHVGEAPPTRPNFVETAFARENQDTTFFVLGLILTLVAAAFGLARVQSRRRRLTRELRAIEHSFNITRENPIECDRALAERRAHIRGLLVDGALDENQFGVCERRIEELGKQVRLSTIDDEMGFLSVSMARTLRGLLADGRIEKWERSHFFEVLEKDKHLSATQKKHVHELLDDWFARDERSAKSS